MVWPIHSLDVIAITDGITPAPVKMIRLAAALNVRLFFSYDESPEAGSSVLINGTELPFETLWINIARPSWKEDAFLDLRALWETGLGLQLATSGFDRPHSGSLGQKDRLDLYLGGLFASPN